MIVLLSLLSTGSIVRAQGQDNSRPTYTDPRQKPASWLPSPVRRFARVSRWQMIDAYGIQVPRKSILDPYNQNPLKGDMPIVGNNLFMVWTLLTIPTVTASSQGNTTPQSNNKIITALEFFHGDTVFKPKDWSIKSSFQSVVNRGNNQLNDIALLDLFGEVKLGDISPWYDFIATRGGIQPFNSDFNGFIFKDINLGVHLFGEMQQNRYQWSMAYFNQRKKSPGKGLTFDAADQQVGIANWIIEDFINPGFNTVFSFHLNRDRSNPLQDLDAYYLGFASDGRLGRMEFNPSLYYAFGTISPKTSLSNSSISALFGGLEWAYPRNFLTYRGAVFLASGDSDPEDDTATGFDSIFDNINLFGGVNSFVVGGNDFLTRNNSFFPAGRSTNQANFVNPGVLLVNAGLDAVLTPKTFLESNYTMWRFMKASMLDLNPPLSNAIGHELNMALAYRPFLNENIVIKAGGGIFFPLSGGKQLLLNNDEPIVQGNLTLLMLF